MIKYKNAKFWVLYTFLEEQYYRYNRPEFIETDPISIPHLFCKKQDIEIAAFFAAMLAWGQRPVIIRNTMALLKRMDFAPADFIINHTSKERNLFKNFCHRTFNGEDCIFFLYSLQQIYRQYGTLEKLFYGKSIKERIIAFRSIFFSLPHLLRTEKHISDPDKHSAAKRLNMFLRWMIRKDNRGVDFGIWESISPSELICPLDIHSGRVARELGLLKRKQNDWRAAEELTNTLKQFDPHDPVKYDFVLFSLGVAKEYNKNKSIVANIFFLFILLSSSCFYFSFLRF